MIGRRELRRLLRPHDVLSQGRGWRSGGYLRPRLPPEQPLRESMNTLTQTVYPARQEGDTTHKPASIQEFCFHA